MKIPLEPGEGLGSNGFVPNNPTTMNSNNENSINPIAKKSDKEIRLNKISELEKRIAKAEVAVENAAHRFEMYASDKFVDYSSGKAVHNCLYPQGKAARTRLFKREEKLARLRRWLAEARAEYAKFYS